MKIIRSNVILDDDRINVLVKESEAEYGEPNGKLESPNIIVDVLNTLFHLNKKAEEYLYLIGMTARNHPISIFEVSHGTSSEAVVSGREIMVRTLLCGASNIVVVHNHPSGDCTPSKEDIETTKRILMVCKLMDIELVDHIIIGADRFFSFKANNMIFT